MKLTGGTFLVLVVLAILGGLYFLWFVPTEIRYRLTVEVDDGGKTVTGSSVIAAYYYRRNPLTSLAPGTGRPAHAVGVAPIIDLGPKGTLIAALNSNNADLLRRGAKPGPTAVGMPLFAYDVDVHYVESALFRGPAKLSEKHYPTFIWIPASGDWRKARQLKSDWLPTPFLPDVRIRHVTFTPSWFASLTEVVDPAPAWLEDMRKHSLTLKGLGKHTYALNSGAIVRH